MHVDVFVVLGSFIVGIAVGLTGMGGGALMTPVLVVIFGVQPLAAVSSDLVASFVMKPVGAAIHLSRRTVQWALVGWLCVGSIPSAFLGAYLLHALGHGADIQHHIQLGLGAALLLAAGALGAKELLARRSAVTLGESAPGRLAPRRSLLVTSGAVGGFIVGVTSVGSGTLIVVCLLLMYPTLRARDVVGTDLMQAIPLVGAAALGHILFGNLQLGLTAALVIGSVPGAFIGAQISSRASGRLIRPVLAFVLLASALKLFSVGTPELGAVLGAALVVGLVAWAHSRARARCTPARAAV